MRTLAVIFLLLPAVTNAQTLTGKVTHIKDGDTFTMLLDGTDSLVAVDLYCVDCPELSQDYGAIAKRFTYDLIFRRHVTVVLQDVGLSDGENNVTGIVYVGTHNINEAVLRAGMGWHYNIYHQNINWDRLQAMARKGKTGLWQDNITSPVPPWEFAPKRKIYPPGPKY